MNTKRKEAIKKLKESEEMYESIFEESPDGILIVDVKTKKFLLANHKICKITGYPLKELLELDVNKIHPKKDLPYVIDQFTKQFQGKITLAKDIPVLRKDKKVIYCDVNSKLIKIAKEDFLVGFFRDITERKKAEEEIKSAQEKWDSLAQNTNDIIMIIDNMGTIQHINKTIPPYTPEKTIGKSVYNYVPKEQQNIIKESLRKVFKTGGSDTYEISSNIPKIGTVWFTTKVVPIKHGGGVNNAILISTNITKRKEMEMILKENEKKYRTLVENIPQKIFLKDKNSVYISCNENYAKDLKIKPEEIAGRTDFEFYPRKLAEKYRADDKRFMKLGETKDIEEKYIQDGKEFWVHTVKTPVRDEKRNVVGILGIFWDITESKKAKEALKKSEEKFRKLFESAVDPIVILDNKGKFIEINKKTEKILGYDRKDLIGKKFTETNILTQKSKLIALENFMKRMIDLEVKPYEIEIIKNDGEKIIGEINAAPIKEDNKVIGDMVIIRDVTEKKKLNDVLKMSEEKWRSLAENYPGVILIVDHYGKIQFINRTVIDASPEKVIGKTVYEYIEPEYHSSVRKTIEQVFKTGKPDRYEVRGIGPKNRISWYETQVGPIKYDEQVIAVTLFTSDVTERKKSEEELKKAKDKLQSKLEDLEKFNKLSIGRELKMVELKKRIKELEKMAQK